MHHAYHPSQITSDNTIFVPDDQLDLDDLEDLAEQRAESYEGDIFKRHYLGLLGEAAIAEAYSVDIDREIYEHGDDGFDLTLKIHEKEKTVDVKTTARKNPSLRIPVSGPKVCEAYVLCTTHGHGITIEGWISADSALSMNYWRKIDGQGYFEIPVDDLNNPPIHPLRRR